MRLKREETEGKRGGRKGGMEGERDYFCSVKWCHLFALACKMVATI